jgi:small subunit ribosomal protein S20
VYGEYSEVVHRMPLTGMALKRQKINDRNRTRRRPLRSEAKTRVRGAREAIAAGDRAEAEKRLKATIKHLDRAASRGAIHRRNAARRKSRLHKAFNAAFGD